MLFLFRWMINWKAFRIFPECLEVFLHGATWRLNMLSYAASLPRQSCAILHVFFHLNLSNCACGMRGDSDIPFRAQHFVKAIEVKHYVGLLFLLLHISPHQFPFRAANWKRNLCFSKMKFLNKHKKKKKKCKTNFLIFPTRRSRFHEWTFFDVLDSVESEKQTIYTELSGGSVYARLSAQGTQN